MIDCQGTAIPAKGRRLEMGTKDKGGANVKKKAQHSLKEKRQAKKSKKSGK
jgi:hypothetical protein